MKTSDFENALKECCEIVQKNADELTNGKLIENEENKLVGVEVSIRLNVFQKFPGICVTKHFEQFSEDHSFVPFVCCCEKTIEESVKEAEKTIGKMETEEQKKEFALLKANEYGKRSVE